MLETDVVPQYAGLNRRGLVVQLSFLSEIKNLEGLQLCVARMPSPKIPFAANVVDRRNIDGFNRRGYVGAQRAEGIEFGISFGDRQVPTLFARTQGQVETLDIRIARKRPAQLCEWLAGGLEAQNLRAREELDKAASGLSDICTYIENGWELLCICEALHVVEAVHAGRHIASKRKVAVGEAPIPKASRRAAEKITPVHN